MARIVKAPDERRSELIATAQQLFYTKGYERTSVSDIVKAVGVAQGTFYYYFDSKQAILEALVADLTAQQVAHLQAIVADETLSAIQKWAQAVHGIGDWKLERKAEILALLRLLKKDGNMLLRHKLSTQRVQMMAPILTEIIVQGIAEGVFETAFVEEAAEIAYAISNAFFDTLADILLNPDSYDNPIAHYWRKYAAVQTAIERVLGAAPGSLSIMDEQMIAAWFEG
jgi:AcrR family transcriptional regulator